MKKIRTNKIFRLLLVLLFLFISLFTIRGTVAYFTDADTVVNSFFVDKNAIEAVEEFEPPIKGKRTLKSPAALNAGSTNCYVRAQVIVSDSRAEEYFSFYYNDTEGFNAGDWKEESDGWLYYCKNLKKGEMTTPVFSHVLLSENIPDNLLGFTVDVIFESVQSKGYISARKAFESLKEGGGTY